MKAAVAQCLAALAVILINFSRTSFITFILNFSIYQIERPRDIASLLDAHSQMMIAGLLLGGLLAQSIGGRTTIIVDAIILAGGYLSLRWITSFTTLTWIVRFVGVTSGMMESSLYVYLAEIAQPKWRNTLVASVSLSTVAGSYLYSYLSRVTSFNTLEWIYLILPVVGCIAMISSTDSPHWLASKGRYHRVESSVAWFRGWMHSINVKLETRAIVDHAQNNQRTLCKLLGQNSFYVSLAIVIYLFAIQAFSGYNLLLSMYAYDKYGALPDMYYFYDFAVVLFFVGVSTFLGKRFLILFSLLTGSIALLLPPICSLLKYFDVLSSNIYYSRVFAIDVRLAVLLLNLGIGQVPLLLNAELFPSGLRYVGAGICLFVSYVLHYASDLLYLKLMKSTVSLNGLFLTLGCVSLFGFVTLFSLFPRNEKRSLIEIEQSCSSISSLKRNH